MALNSLAAFGPRHAFWGSTYLSLALLVATLGRSAGQTASGDLSTPTTQEKSKVIVEQPQSRYQWRAVHDPDGIGKFYSGREIAQVMGHQGADWLERPEREEEERPSVLLDNLKLGAGETVADIGAGSGYLSWRLARLVGAGGRVYAVDVQQEMLDLLSQKMHEHKVANVVPVLGTITNASLSPQSIDLALMVDVYHEFSHPYEMMQSLCLALKPGARVIFVEYRAEDPDVPIKLLHKMSVAQVRNEMALQPLEWVETLSVLPRQHIIIFRKRP